MKLQKIKRRNERKNIHFSSKPPKYSAFLRFWKINARPQIMGTIIYNKIISEQVSFVYYFSNAFALTSMVLLMKRRPTNKMNKMPIKLIKKEEIQ